VMKRLPGVEICLIGAASNESSSDIKTMIETENLGNRVKIVGEIPRRDVLIMLSESDVYLFPSKSEGFPLSVLEAMAVGLPVVASDVGAIPEMIDVPQGGFLYPPEDVDGFVEGIENLRDSLILRRNMGEYNRNKARRDFDYGVVMDRLCQIYLAAIIQ